MQANHAREGSEIPVTDATLPGPPWWSQSPLDASSFPVHTALLFALSALPDGHGLLAQPSRCSDCRNPLSQPAVQAVVGVDIDIDIDSGDQTRQPYLISSAAHQRPSIVVLDDTTPARYRCRLSFFLPAAPAMGSTPYAPAAHYLSLVSAVVVCSQLCLGHQEAQYRRNPAPRVLHPAPPRVSRPHYRVGALHRLRQHFW
ncbi:hypothetical protein HBI57_220960 [Parastagonospora nodorum]|nr:hypothetical protein HBI57_220960 [Parastagonospora nodorum]